MCCASAALPPLPAKKSVPPPLRVSAKRPAKLAIASAWSSASRPASSPSAWSPCRTWLGRNGVHQGPQLRSRHAAPFDGGPDNHELGARLTGPQGLLRRADAAAHEDDEPGSGLATRPDDVDRHGSGRSTPRLELD